MPTNADISLKGLDSFSRKFLAKDVNAPSAEKEYIHVAPGQRVSAENMKRYEETRQTDFIRRSGSFTEDLVAFVVEQKRLRMLDDTETVFALALANINLRNAYGSPQNGETLSAGRQAELLAEFDEICRGAQDYYDANAGGD